MKENVSEGCAHSLLATTLGRDTLGLDGPLFQVGWKACHGHPLHSPGSKGRVGLSAQPKNFSVKGCFGNVLNQTPPISQVHPLGIVIWAAVKLHCSDEFDLVHELPVVSGRSPAPLCWEESL